MIERLGLFGEKLPDKKEQRVGHDAVEDCISRADPVLSAASFAKDAVRDSAVGDMKSALSTDQTAANSMPIRHETAGEHHFHPVLDAVGKSLKAIWAPHDGPFIKLVPKIVGQTGLALVATVAADVIFENLTHMSVGNAGKDAIKEMIKVDPLRQAAYMLIGAPLLEEGLFRVAPSLCRDLLAKGKDIGKACLGTGIAVTGLFALSHNIVPGTSEHALALGNSLALSYLIPLPQLVLGTFFWQQMRQHGIRGAVLAHALVNSLPTAMMVLNK